MGFKRRTKTKRRTRDVDQVQADLKSPKHLHQYKITKAAEDLPGLGQFYCVECAKWFEGAHNLQEHSRGKAHKRRLRALKEEPYTQKDAEAAIGLRTDNGSRIHADSSTHKGQATALEQDDVGVELMETDS